MSTHPLPDIVVFSTADWFVRYWTNKQHTAARLAARGHRVVYVESVGLRRPQISDTTDRRRLLRRLITGLSCLVFGPKQVRPNLWVLSPLTIPMWQRLKLVQRINRAFLGWPLRRFLAKIAAKNPQIWTYHPYVLGAITSIDFSSLSYHGVDDLSAVPGIDGQDMDRAELEILQRSDVVFATSKTLEQRFRTVCENTHYFPNVVDADHFGVARTPGSLPADLSTILKPRLGYHGVLSSYKIDFALLEAVAKTHPEWHLVLIGDAREGQDASLLAHLREMPNVHFLGGKDYAVLPDYLSGFDVGLLPTLRNKYTASMFPMKYFEYVAAGVPVASTRLEFAREADGILAMGDNTASFSQAIKRQLARGRLSDREIQTAIGDNTWEQRLDKVLALTTKPESERS